MWQPLLPYLIFAIVVVVIPLTVSWRSLAPIERFGRRLARRPRVACGVVFLFSLAVNAGVTLSTRIPVPVVQDEFSYLLSADTFSHWRLTNPTHPMWKSFETFHVLDHPTYQSKYPPGQGATLAVGKALTGLPIAGVWLTTAMASAAICWMLMAWAPSRWALLGGLMTALHPMLLKWGQTYWGGTLPLGGAALVFGGLRRCVDGPSEGRLRAGVAMGVGASILALSRPYEGAIMVLFALIILGVEGLKNRVSPMDARRIVLGVGAPLAVALVFIGYYDLRVTGNPTTLPYALYERQYGAVPVFLMEKMRPLPHFDNVPMRVMVTDYNVPLYRAETQSPLSMVEFMFTKLMLLGRFALQTWDLRAFPLDPFDAIRHPFVDAVEYLLAVPLLALPFLWPRDRWVRWAMLGLAVGAGAILTETWINTHYTAPSAPLAAFVLVACLRVIWVTRWKRRSIGRSLVRTIVVLYVAGFCASYLQYRNTHQKRPQVGRAVTEARLSRLRRPQLVLVRYVPDTDWDAEIVYNDADIDKAKVVWARELDADQNRKLLAYYPNRTAWLYIPETHPATLVPYPSAASVLRSPPQ